VSIGARGRKVAAAVLYAVGVVAVFIAAYLYRVEPNASSWVVLLWGPGVVLVAAAAVLWPKDALSEPDDEPDERGNGTDDGKAGAG
jgi:steroid 5-alpha reductase family enzyme